MKLSSPNLLWENGTTSLSNPISTTELANNFTNEENVLFPISLVIPITVIYVIIFFTGLIGNVSTCIVICRNKSMHTATNYYLFSLAISDLLLLVSGLPPETYRIWSPETYVFGEAFCVLQGFAAETSANATVLTITAFTVERYLAICHPFLSHTMSKLSRAVKYVIVIWIAALCLAAPQAMQFGVEYIQVDNGEQHSRCTVVSTQFYFQHAFEISTFVFFVGPMTVITVLYVLIAIKLKKARTLSIRRRNEDNGNINNEEISTHRTSRNTSAQKRVIKMLVAVVVAFFVCWAPFHAQRLLAVYLSSASPEDQEAFVKFYIVLMYTSGILYFVSTTINPVLYNIMSKKFREAFKSTFAQLCGRESERRVYSSLARSGQSFKNASNIVPMTGMPTTNGYFRQRQYSGASQTTVLTNVSKSADQNDKRHHRQQLARSVSTVHNQIKISNKPSLLSYGVFKIFGKNQEVQNGSAARQGSIESGHSANTMSNSSLQHVDNNDFNCTELVQIADKICRDLAT